jgi:hypothetical protein
MPITKIKVYVISSEPFFLLLREKRLSMKLRLGQIIIRKHNMLSHFNKHVMCKWRIRTIFLQKTYRHAGFDQHWREEVPAPEEKVGAPPALQSRPPLLSPFTAPAASALTRSGGEERHGEERRHHDESGEWRAAPRQGER